MTEPIVSIVIPNKNRSDELVETLTSVQGQTFNRFQCIVVDDNSTDDFEQRVAPFRSDPRFVFVRQKPGRGGAPAARNDGATLASGEFLIWLDSDDLLAPFCLENRLRIMQSNPELDFAVFPCELFRRTPGDTALLWNADTGENDLDRFLRHDVPWQTTGPIWRKASLSKVGPWDEQARSAQDWEFHVRAVLQGLRYQRFGPVDFYWRMASAERSSIGKAAAIDKEYHRARLELYRRILQRVRAAGAMNEDRRKCFAGMYFTAVETIAKKVNRREARRLWRSAIQDAVVSRAEYYQGLWLLWNMRWERRYQRLRSALQGKWPGQYFLPRSPTFMKTPAPRREKQLAEVG
ncbi:MAG: glycosyltransferase family 2 protein [Phycisphaerae bacterium]|nr:glycosyltransferase family 2 protein [Phycisphaerae bacterium]MDW8260900.1 glycosyltransferase [Phycisphaerales bacterium]